MSIQDRVEKVNLDSPWEVDFLALVIHLRVIIKDRGAEGKSRFLL